MDDLPLQSEIVDETVIAGLKVISIGTLFDAASALLASAGACPSNKFVFGYESLNPLVEVVKLLKTLSSGSLGSPLAKLSSLTPTPA